MCRDNSSLEKSAGKEEPLGYPITVHCPNEDLANIGSVSCLDPSVDLCLLLDASTFAEFGIIF